MTAQIPLESVNLTNTTNAIQKLVELHKAGEEHELCNRLHKFYHCLLNLVNEDCLINRVYVTFFNEIESRLREFKCKQSGGEKNRKFFYYFKTRFYSSEFNDEEDDALDGNQPVVINRFF